MENIVKSNEMNELQGKGNAEKSSRFVTWAEKRTRKVLYDIDVLQKCFDRLTYDYTEDQAAKILDALEAKIAELRSASECGSNRTHFAL